MIRKRQHDETVEAFVEMCSTNQNFRNFHNNDEDTINALCRHYADNVEKPPRG